MGGAPDGPSEAFHRPLCLTPPVRCEIDAAAHRPQQSPEDRPMQNSYPVETVGEAFLVLLKQRGIHNFYTNGGPDFPSIHEPYARQPQSGLDFPKPIVCAHENL